MKRRLVTAILGSLKETKTPGWALSEAYQRYITRSVDDLQWQPELDYYVRLVQRLVESKYQFRVKILSKFYVIVLNYFT